MRGGAAGRYAGQLRNLDLAPPVITAAAAVPIAVAGHHEGVAWWNFAFLFTITAMPFTSSRPGEYGNTPLAVDIFAVNVLLATLATQATLLFAQRADVLIAPGRCGSEQGEPCPPASGSSTSSCWPRCGKPT